MKMETEKETSAQDEDKCNIKRKTDSDRQEEEN
jgi:hypothetical protein